MIRPRRLAWSGRVAARGLWLDLALLGEEEARRRILALWQPGCVLCEADGGWWLTFEGLRSLAAPFPGTPLVPDEGVLVGTPLDRREWARLDARPDSAWIIRAGQLTRLQAGKRVDPGRWLDLDNLTLVQGKRLGPELDALRAAVPPSRSLRVDFSQFDFIDDGHFQRAGGGGYTEDAALTREPPAWARPLIALLSAFDGVLNRLRPRPPMRPLDPRVPTPPRPPTWVDRMRHRLASWMRRLVGLRHLAREDAKWLDELFSAFDRGDLEAALRRAIPLGGTESGPPGGGRRRLREHLTPSLRGPSGSAMVFGGMEVERALRLRYEAAARTLEEHGRIVEAAFVLADLLLRPAEAVHLLEVHGLLVEAAELAEGRELDPHVVVRQWMLAGDLARTVLLARRHDAWGQAIALFRPDAPEAIALRRLWAETRAAAGNLVGAFEVAWVEPALRDDARDWLRAALDDAGPTGARALAAAWTREDPTDLLPRAQALLAEPGPSGISRREAFARALLATNDYNRDHAPQHRQALDRRLGSRLARALIADPPLTDAAFHRGLIDRLMGGAGADALQRDRPRDDRPATGISRSHWPAADAGELPIRDLAVLPDGRLIVACGSAGVRLIDPQGRLLRQFPLPADHLVVGDDGHRLIALQDLDDGVRAISKVDLRTGAIHPWARAALGSFATTFDGEAWCVVQDGELLVIDTLDDDWRHLWRVPPDGRLVAITRDASSLRGIVRHDGGRFDLWRWDLPSVTLRARVPARHDGNDVFEWYEPFFAGAEVLIFDPSTLDLVQLGVESRVLLARTEAQPDAGLIALGGRVEGKRAVLLWLDPAMDSEGGTSALHVQHRVPGGTVSLVLEDASGAVIRRGTAGTWVIGDAKGRIIALDPEGRVVLDLRS